MIRFQRKFPIEPGLPSASHMALNESTVAALPRGSVVRLRTGFGAGWLRFRWALGKGQGAFAATGVGVGTGGPLGVS